jgi:hypothetical protein
MTAIKIEYATKFFATFELEEDADAFFSMIPLMTREVTKYLALDGLHVVTGWVEPDLFETFENFVTDEGNWSPSFYYETYKELTKYGK